ncbi:MAG TPA: DNRLRE domain-containing protein, partial [Chthonomonadales bacterium]|nr:DNRLRE domain-containing protein [Chthonomonadales bacterium]
EILVGRIFDDDVSRFKGLVRFTNLSIPAGSKVVSAKLSLFCNGFSGKPQIGVFGLLKPFSEGSSRGTTARAGETTWNMLRHGEAMWGTPGVGSGSDGYDFDGPADFHTPADATVSITEAGWYEWDVTPSFSRQWNAGKDYGWLIMETSDRPATYAGFRTREAAIDELPSLLYPKLTVTFIPPRDAALPAAPVGPKLINFYFGHPEILTKDPERLAKLPFDGGVFHGEDNRNLGSGEGSIVLNVFGPEKLDVKNYSHFIACMKAIQKPPSPLQDNFLRFNVVPGTLERKDVPYNWENRPRRNEMVTMWFSDFDTVVHNVRVAAMVAREAGMRGLLFDWEEYAGDIFNYDRLKDAHDQGKSSEETRQQVRKCAERIGKAIAETYPTMTLIIIPGVYSIRKSELLTAFMDGLIAACDPRTRIVDGNEKYHLFAATQFWEAYDFHYKQAPAMSAVPEKYLRQVEVGFGVHIDRYGWGPNPEWIYSSARWQTKLENALTVADSYVWVFTGGGNAANQADWWTGQNLPQDYIEATRKAREWARLTKGGNLLRR